MSIFNPTSKFKCVSKWVFLASCLLLLSVTLAFGSTDQKLQDTIALLNAQEYTAALEKLSDLEEAVINPEGLNNLWASAYLGRGYQLLASGEFADARTSFQNGRLYREDDVRLWQAEAMTWFKEGRYSEASSLLDQALGYDSNNADIYHLLARSYYAEGRMPEALEALQRSLDIAENDRVAELYQKVEREWQVEQEMEQEYRGHFQLSFVDGGPTSSLAGEVLAVLEDAYAELGSDLNFYPQVSVPVLLYTRSEYSAVTNSPDWSGALYDGKIRLPLAGVAKMNDRLTALLYHEYMHVLVHFLTNRHVPVWLNEGLAEVAGRRIYRAEHMYNHRPVGENLLDWQTLSGSFAKLDSADVPLAYEQSYLLTSYMIENYGWHTMTELLKDLAKQRDWQAAIAGVYKGFGVDWPTILREWQAGLN